MFQHLCVDMDGVLCDFVSAALAKFGWSQKAEVDGGILISHPEFSDRIYPFGCWDMASVIGVTEDEFWSKLHSDENFFSTLSPTSHAKDLLSLIQRYGVPFTIATSPSRDPRDAMHKTLWIREFLGKPTFRDIMVGHQKHLMANPRHLLIDDSPSNIRRFRNAGGSGFLWPAFWNDAHSYRNDPVRRLELYLYHGIQPHLAENKSIE